MEVNLLDYTYTPVEFIGMVAAKCYDGKTDAESNKRRATHCKDSGHLAVLRFSYATFEINGISRVCSHQLVRVAHAGILQASARYIKQTNIEYVVPESLPTELKQEWGAILKSSSDMYQKALDAGMSKGDARYILPQGCTTSLNMTGNFQMWRDLLKNRTHKAADWEVRQVAIQIQNHLNQIAPEIFDKIC